MAGLTTDGVNVWDEVVAAIEDRLRGQDECWLLWKSVRDLADHQRWPSEQRRQLHAELLAAGIMTYPGLDVVHPSGKDRITFFREDRKEKYFGLRFVKETHFRSTMLKGMHRIPELQDLRQIKKEYRLRNNRRIDVLAKRGRDTWVVIEVKRATGDRRSPASWPGTWRTSGSRRMTTATNLSGRAIASRPSSSPSS